MPTASVTFYDRVEEALQDEQLQKALDISTTRFTQGRARALEALPEADALRDHARRIRAHTIANLDRYLAQFAAAVELSDRRWVVAEHLLHRLVDQGLALSWLGGEDVRGHAAPDQTTGPGVDQVDDDAPHWHLPEAHRGGASAPAPAPPSTVAERIPVHT